MAFYINDRIIVLQVLRHPRTSSRRILPPNLIIRCTGRLDQMFVMNNDNNSFITCTSATIPDQSRADDCEKNNTTLRYTFRRDIVSLLLNVCVCTIIL